MHGWSGIIEHLTDKNRDEFVYENYLNVYNESDYAEFYYEFLIGSKIVTYEYRKTNYKTIINKKCPKVSVLSAFPAFIHDYYGNEETKILIG